jgi:hypothetical protein
VAGVDLNGAASSAYAEGRIEKRAISTGALVPTFGSGGVVVSSAAVPVSLAVDGASLFVAGTDPRYADGRWRIEKRAK